jgi:hypothetical protein
LPPWCSVRPPTLLLTSGLLALWCGCTGPNPLFEPSDSGAGEVLAPADGRPAPDAGTGVDAAADAAGEGAADAMTAADAPVDAGPDLPAADVSPTPDAPAPDAPAPDAPAADASALDAPAPADGAADLPPPVELVAGLLGYWRFDEADGARTLRDSSGRGNAGVFEGSSSGTAFVPGKFGRGFELATPDRNFGIRVTATAAIQALQRYTLAAWVYRRQNTPSEYCGIISRQIDGKDAEVFNMMVSKDYLKAYGPDRDSSTGTVTTASTPTTTPLNVWFHAAATFDGNRIRIYQDGVERGYDTWTAPLPPASTPVYLATKKVVNYAHPFIGVLDEVLLYDRALPPEAILALARGDRPPVP